MVPPLALTDLWASIIWTTGFGDSGSNSDEFACFMPHRSLAISMMATCMPRHIPKNGILFSLAYLIEVILPSTPLLPKPPGIRMPSTPFNMDCGPFFSTSSESMYWRLTLQLFAMAAWMSDSCRLLYESCMFTYLPTIPIVISFFWLPTFLMSASQASILGCLVQILRSFTIFSSNPWLWKTSGTSWMHLTSWADMTASLSTLQNRAILALSS